MRFATHFLNWISIEAYGALHRRRIGPFAPGLTVVFGPNEAGKSTIASFIGGVLFGWPESRGTRNPYRPDHAERAGKLSFAPIPNAASENAGGGEAEGEPSQAEAGRVLLSRARNADGVVREGDTDVLADIERAVFETVFSLTSDELLSLGRGNDITARLLTAGAGTQTSPAHALDALDARIAAYRSRSPKEDRSIPQREERIAELRQEVAEAREQAAAYKREDAELAELVRAQEEQAVALRRFDARIESLRQASQELAALRERAAQLDEREGALERDLAALDAERDAFRSLHDDELPAFSPLEERALRDSLDEYAHAAEGLDRAFDLAQSQSASSKASFEALRETLGASELAARRRRQRTLQAVLSAFFPTVFAGLGLATFLHGREIGSLSFTAFGILLVGAAIVIAGAALVMLARPNRVESDAESRLSDAEWVKIQDEKKLETARARLIEHTRALGAFLEGSGLGRAQGSVRRARAVLDEVAEVRSQEALFSQRLQSLEAASDALIEERERIRSARLELLSSEDVRPATGAEELAERLEEALVQRDALLTTRESTAARIGELRQILRRGRQDHRFDELKQRLSQEETRLADAHEELSTLLLARELIARSIAQWERESQPLVYQTAGSLLADMTGGAWDQIVLDEKGELRAVDAFGASRPTHLLSLGTCQQLYLSLRIALLLTAQDVGRNIPLIADDILVHFDEERRRGAARALARLAEHRQVILLTCHEDIVRLMREASPGSGVIRL